MKKFYFPLLVIFLAVIWLFSGWIASPPAKQAPSISQINQIRTASVNDRLVRVRAHYISAFPQTEIVVVRGLTRANRVLDVRAETTGRVVDIPVKRGGRVIKGDPLCYISLDSREVKKDEADAALKQAKMEYQSFKELRDKGLQSEIGMVASEARFFARRAELQQRKLDLDRTTVTAPFDAVVERLTAEVGTYMQIGTICVQIVDLDPIIFGGRVTEKDLGRLKLGQTAHASLLDGQNIKGVLTFISKNAGDLNRTYDIEIRAPNPDFLIAAGLTANITIPVSTLPAHLITPALLGLNDLGEIGIRILDADNRVIFQVVEILKDSPEGLWVTGLPENAKVITLGQELVTAGELVEVTLESMDSSADAAKNTPAASKQLPKLDKRAG